MLNNLLSNAIKFTPRGGVVLGVSAERRGEGWRLRINVADTGPGLSPGQLERLFTAYDQLGADTARTFGGTGLGLSISRDLARLMDGGPDRRAPAEGGAVFHLTLPVAVGVEPLELTIPATSPTAFDGAPLVLVVDDHDVNRRLLSQVLGAMGLSVELAADGEAGLALAGERRFDAILVDVNMPGLDGLDTTRRLRAEGPNRATPVIAVTAGVSTPSGKRAASPAWTAGSKSRSRPPTCIAPWSRRWSRARSPAREA